MWLFSFLGVGGDVGLIENERITEREENGIPINQVVQ